MPHHTATCYFRVIERVPFPVQANPGEYLSVWPGDPNLLVFDATGQRVVCEGYFPEGKLWSELFMLLEKKAIAPLSSSELYRIGHALRGSGGPLRPFLRVWRLA